MAKPTTSDPVNEPATTSWIPGEEGSGAETKEAKPAKKSAKATKTTKAAKAKTAKPKAAG